MAEKVTLEARFVADLDTGDWQDALGDGWKLVEERLAGTWRWGTEYEYIIQRQSTGQHYIGTLRFHTTEGLEGNDGPETFTAVTRVERVTHDWEVEQ